jgi:hypothetical protein
MWRQSVAVGAVPFVTGWAQSPRAAWAVVAETAGARQPTNAIAATSRAATKPLSFRGIMIALVPPS